MRNFEFIMGRLLAMPVLVGGLAEIIHTHNSHLEADFRDENTFAAIRANVPASRYHNVSNFMGANDACLNVKKIGLENQSFCAVSLIKSPSNTGIDAAFACILKQSPILMSDVPVTAWSIMFVLAKRIESKRVLNCLWLLCQHGNAQTLKQTKVSFTFFH